MGTIFYKGKKYSSTDDYKVSQRGDITTNSNFELLLSTTADSDLTEIGELKKGKGLYYNPYSKELNVLNGSIIVGNPDSEAEDYGGVSITKTDILVHNGWFTEFGQDTSLKYCMGQLNIGKVSKSGDTMTGNLTIGTSSSAKSCNVWGGFNKKTSGITVNTSSNNGVSSSGVGGGLYITDSNDYSFCRIRGYGESTGATWGDIAVYNKKTDGTEIENHIRAYVNKDGTKSYDISAPASFRSAISCPTMISDTHPTLLPTGGSNNWIKIGTSNTTYGILPSTSGNVGSGHNYIGTSTWYWKYAYVDEIYAARIMLQNSTDASGTANNKPALIVGGTDSQAHIEIDSNEIIAKSNGTTSTTLYLQDGNGILSLQGSDYSVANQAKFRTAIGMGNATINKGANNWGTSTSVTCVGVHCIVMFDKMFGILWLSETNDISINYVHTDGKSYNAGGTGSVTWGNGKYKATRSNHTITVTSTSNSSITLLGL